MPQSARARSYVCIGCVSSWCGMDVVMNLRWETVQSKRHQCRLHVEFDSVNARALHFKCCGYCLAFNVCVCGGDFAFKVCDSFNCPSNISAIDLIEMKLSNLFYTSLRSDDDTIPSLLFNLCLPFNLDDTYEHDCANSFHE